jgi:hypothetical protein
MMGTRPLHLCVILALVLCALCAAAQEAPSRPHVVIILADDMGIGDPQCYNAQSLIPTPISILPGTWWADRSITGLTVSLAQRAA